VAKPIRPGPRSRGPFIGSSRLTTNGLLGRQQFEDGGDWFQDELGAESPIQLGSQQSEHPPRQANDDLGYFFDEGMVEEEVWAEVEARATVVAAQPALPVGDQDYDWNENYDDPVLADIEWSPIQPNAPPTGDQPPDDAFDWGSVDLDDDWSTLIDDDDDANQSNAPVSQDQPPDDAWPWLDDEQDEFLPDDPVAPALPANGIDDAWDWDTDHDDWAPVDEAQSQNPGPALDDAWPLEADEQDDWQLDDFVHGTVVAGAAELSPPDAWEWDDYADSDSISLGSQQSDAAPLLPYTAEDAWPWDDVTDDQPDWLQGTDDPVGANAPAQLPYVSAHEWDDSQDDFDDDFFDHFGNEDVEMAGDDAWPWDQADEDLDDWSVWLPLEAQGTSFVQLAGLGPDDAWPHDDTTDDITDWYAGADDPVGPDAPVPLPYVSEDAWPHDDVTDDTPDWFAGNDDAVGPDKPFVTGTRKLRVIGSMIVRRLR
jgi:hypothetical protein